MKYLARLRAARVVDLPSGAVAVTLTAAAFAAVFVVSARTLLLEYATPPVDRPAAEALVYLERPVSAVPPVRQSLVPSSSRMREMPAPATQRAGTVSGRITSPTRPKAEGLAGPSSVLLPPTPVTPRFTPSPFGAPRPRNPFLSEEPRTRAEMDSILAVLRHDIPLLALTRKPTAEERDALMRAQSSAGAVTIPGRKPQIVLFQGSVGLPLFASGPSAAERRRDSAANSEYVARLRRLQARVSASRESLRVADSMSRARMP